jgi:hypothetical protein
MIRCVDNARNLAIPLTHFSFIEVATVLSSYAPAIKQASARSIATVVVDSTKALVLHQVLGSFIYTLLGTVTKIFRTVELSPLIGAFRFVYTLSTWKECEPISYSVEYYTWSVAIRTNARYGVRIIRIGRWCGAGESIFLLRGQSCGTFVSFVYTAKDTICVGILATFLTFVTPISFVAKSFLSWTCTTRLGLRLALELSIKYGRCTFGAAVQLGK